MIKSHDEITKELGVQLGYLTALFMSQDIKGTEMIMPLEDCDAIMNWLKTTLEQRDAEVREMVEGMRKSNIKNITYKLIMKTLADLKRKLQVGTEMTLIAYEHPTHKFLNIPRYIVKTQGNGIYLAEDKEAIKGSFMDFPSKAALCEYDGETLSIFNPGRRPLTPDEQKIRDNQPSHRKENQAQLETDIMTDGSQIFYKDKAYFEDMDAVYLAGHETVRGLHFNMSDGDITDHSIKGELSLKYKITS